ncbi:GntR family transcriptional regulator [Sinomonas sp. P10A9]|uniref:GntR family transcriptional regulator n=1 Tax=Sinomonas puerhi TaxID=3238584 RepID=A0AB39L3D8_9MICC
MSIAIAKRVEPALLTDQVYETIHQAILSGELPGGSRLTVRELADQVGTSAMPVREAIRRLEESGMVAREPHKGAVVKTLTLEELLHVYDMRRLLEVEAARLGAPHVTAQDGDRMQAEYDLMLTAIREHEVIALLDHDEALLEILYGRAGNPLLVRMIRNLWQQCRAYKIVGADGTLSAAGDDSLWRYQEDLIAAARHRDPIAAAAVNEASLANATDRIRKLLAAQTSAV